MLRKVKSYLNTLQVIDSESELDRMSLDCEPMPPGASMIGSSSAAQQRRRGPSPSPSSLSSHSNQSDQKNQRFAPKFGKRLKIWSLLKNIKPKFRR